MTFSVVWTADAENDLAAVWLAAADRAAVTAAAHAIERDLRLDPLAVGESRESSVKRVVFAEPLGIAFSVIVDDRTVYVTAVWSIK
jgi:plasmid stabilization system protein ParE